MQGRFQLARVAYLLIFIFLLNVFHLVQTRLLKMEEIALTVHHNVRLVQVQVKIAYHAQTIIFFTTNLA